MQLDQRIEFPPSRQLQFRDLWVFFGLMLIFWLISSYWWLHFGYNGTFRYLNQFQIPALSDASLYFFTHWGDGVVLPSLALIFFWRKNPSFALSFIAAVLLTGALTQIGKVFLFHDWMRPPKIFEADPSIHIWHPHPPSRHSFPSGHATSIATGGIFFAWGFSQYGKWVQGLIALFTIFLCFTRVIIGVHFPGDIFIGSMIGSWGAFAILRFLHPLIQSRLGRMRKYAQGRPGWLVVGIAFVAASLQLIHLAGFF